MMSEAGPIVSYGRLGPLVVAQIFEIGIEDVVVIHATAVCRIGNGTIVVVRLVGFVDGFTKFHRRFGHVLDARLDLRCVVCFQLVLQRGNGQFDRFDRGWVYLITMLFH